MRSRLGKCPQTVSVRVCENGHEDIYNVHPRQDTIRCPICGAVSLTKCPHCGAAIKARYIGGIPRVCGNCGQLYPWASKERMAGDE